MNSPWMNAYRVHLRKSASKFFHTLMSRHLHSTKFITLAFIVSLAFHALVVRRAIVYLTKPAARRCRVHIPVEIVNLPQGTAQESFPRSSSPFPSLRPPSAAAGAEPLSQTAVPEKPRPAGAVPTPKKFGRQ